MGKPARLFRGKILGKYKLAKRLGEGGFGEVWKGRDRVEGIDVALKIPQAQWISREHIKIFEDEVKLVGPLDHHNIVKIKTADVIRGRFVIVTRCGKESLADRMRRARQIRFIISVISQILNGLAYAHHHKIIHRDVKPENIILFEDGTVRITDFGIAKICERTLVRGEGTGTIGYMAPEQAYGQTSYASDVFSAGILFYELLTGKLPPWPFEWPYPQHEILARRVPKPVLFMIKKATAFNPIRRYPDAARMEQAWMRALKLWKRTAPGRKKTKRKGAGKKPLHWREYKIKTFVRQHGNVLGLDYTCFKCHYPVSEFMRTCPWCGEPKNSFRSNTTFPAYCEQCEHGVHSDWRFCPWCFRPRFRKVSSVPSRDKRYTDHCTNPRCHKPMIPFMRYCPYCHKKVVRPWKHLSLKGKCPHCRWGVSKDYWDFCCWCGTELG